MHRLSQIDSLNRTAICQHCGEVTIRRHRKSWRCNKADREGRKNRWHLYHKTNEQRREYYQNRKKRVVAHYSQNTMKCAKCGFGDLRALSIDHINGNGSEHRKQIGKSRLYSWLVKNKFPSGFQVLCMNCQFIKAYENQEYKKPLPVIPAEAALCQPARASWGCVPKSATGSVGRGISGSFSTCSTSPGAGMKGSGVATVGSVGSVASTGFSYLAL